MAAPQPDFHASSKCLIAAGKQVLLLPNLPAIDHERYIREQFTALRQGMEEQFRLLRVELDTRSEQVHTRLEQLTPQLGQVNARVEEMGTRFTNLELSTKAE